MVFTVKNLCVETGYIKMSYYALLKNVFSRSPISDKGTLKRVKRDFLSRTTQNWWTKENWSIFAAEENAWRFSWAQCNIKSPIWQKPRRSDWEDGNAGIPIKFKCYGGDLNGKQKIYLTWNEHWRKYI